MTGRGAISYCGNPRAGPADCCNAASIAAIAAIGGERASPAVLRHCGASCRVPGARAAAPQPRAKKAAAAIGRTTRGARPVTTCSAETQTTGGGSQGVCKAVADPLDSPPVARTDPTLERTGSEPSEVVSRGIGPVLFSFLLATRGSTHQRRFNGPSEPLPRASRESASRPYWSNQ